MKAAICEICDEVEDLQVAEHEGWLIGDRFDERIYGYHAVCKKCLKDNQKAIVGVIKVLMEG